MTPYNNGSLDYKQSPDFKRLADRAAAELGAYLYAQQEEQEMQSYRPAWLRERDAGAVEA